MSSLRLSHRDLRHPDSLLDANEWDLWRDTFRGGEDYRYRYLKPWSGREEKPDFLRRRECTPIPTFAKAAILDIRNSIYQRLGAISRVGGSSDYNRAVAGEMGGVDRKGSSMNSFIGIDVLTELLIMGRVGIFVDAPSVVPTTLAEPAQSPYLYMYQIEDILNWTLERPENPGQFKSVLLRDFSITVNNDLGVPLPSQREERLRLVWKDDITGKVHYKIMDGKRNVIRLPESGPDGSVMLDIEIVPFVMPSIGDSLMKDVASYQIALLNMVSADVMWAIESNTPFLTIQTDLRTVGSHLKKPNHAENAEPGGQPAQNNEEQIGSGRGRYYEQGMDRPDFIAPPTGPLQVSMALQEKLEDDIRKLVNLAVANKSGSRTESAEAKKLSAQGLEAGLSYIGLVLQEAEQIVAGLWASYESRSDRNVATVSYPDRYILKEDGERLDEAMQLLDLADRIPGHQMKKQLYGMVASVLLSGKNSSEEIESIIQEIVNADYTTTDLEYILRCQEAGLVSDETSSDALGFKPGEVEKAREDKARRAVAVLAAQTSFKDPDGVPANPASRGVPDLDTNPQSGVEEQAAGREEAE